MSGTEIVVILLLALVVLGPEKLPDAIRKFGKTYAELKKMGTGFQQEASKSAMDEPMREMRETADLLKKSADFTTPDFTSAAPKKATDAVADRPARNDGLAPADPDIVPTEDVPFADEDGAAADVAANDDGATADVAADEDGAAADVAADKDDAVPAGVVDDPPDESTERGGADDA